MRTNELIALAALGVIGWMLYRYLDQRAERIASTTMPTPEPWSPYPILSIPRIPLPLIEADPAPAGSVDVQYEIHAPEATSPSVETSFCEAYCRGDIQTFADPHCNCQILIGRAS